MKIRDREISDWTKPYIIAEISGNHGGSIKNAIELICLAKKVGADAVKTQCYEPDSITLNCNKPDFIVQAGLWKGRTLYDLYNKACTPFEWHAALYEAADTIGIPIFSSVFDYRSVDLLERLNAPAYKIASFEIGDIPLIKYAAKTGKPLIISTGLASDDEVDRARKAAPGSAFLHCTSDYPASVEMADLNRIWRLHTLVGPDCTVGISDHSAGSLVPIMATAMGASIIEKHLMLPGTKSEDDEFSMTPEEFLRMVYDVRAGYEALRLRKQESPSMQFRRSLYAVADIKVGDIHTMENTRSIRPGYGMAPRKLPKLLGTKAKHEYRRGDRIK